jgi:glycosyltransferase involved in cell wall biosynthesis
MKKAKLPFMNKEKYSILVVIAAYNEGEVIKSVVTQIPRSLPALGTVDVIVIDDGSSDESGSFAVEAGALVIRHPINRGQGAALKTGFDYAIKHGYDIVVTLDADGQHKVDEIELLVSKLLNENLDIVLGSRFLGSAPNITKSRYIILKIGVLFTRLLSRVNVTDTHNGFRAIMVSALRRMRIQQDRMEHASEIIDQIHQQQLVYGEVPVTIEYTDYSRLKGQNNGAALKIAGKMLADKLMR